jgi:hypothetical protein
VHNNYNNDSSSTPSTKFFFSICYRTLKFTQIFENMREIEKTKPTTHFQKVTTTVKYCHHHHHQMYTKSELLDPVLTHLRKLASVKGDLGIRKRRGCEADQRVRACVLRAAAATANKRNTGKHRYLRLGGGLLISLPEMPARDTHTESISGKAQYSGT